MDIPLTLHLLPVVCVFALIAAVLCTSDALLKRLLAAATPQRGALLLAPLCLVAAWQLRMRVAAPQHQPLPPSGLAIAYLNSSLLPPYPLDFACYASDGSRGTCSPSFCSALASQTLSQPVCPYPGSATAAPNYAAKMAALVPRTCSQSQDARCTTAALSALFAGQPAVKGAVCSDSYLLVWSDQTPGSGASSNLGQIPFPPGGSYTNSTTGATVTCRTGDASVGPGGLFTWRFFLTPTLLPSASLSNNLNTKAFPTSNWLKGTAVYYPLPEDGAVGFTVSGQEVFPVYNNRAQLTPEKCEVDACNSHVGQGGGQPHLHGDSFGPWCLYSAANYTPGAHPPQIGFSLDGYLIYGRYLSQSAWSADGPLDICGGHSHGAFSYHYHPQVVDAVTDSGLPNGIAAGLHYPATTVGPYQCWRGNVSADPYWGVGPGNSPANQHCSASTQYYVAPGMTLPGAASPSATGTASPSPSAIPTASPTPSAMSTTSPTPSATGTPSATFSSGASPSGTPSASPTPPGTPTALPTASPSRSPSPSTPPPLSPSPSGTGTRSGGGLAAAPTPTSGGSGSAASASSAALSPGAVGGIAVGAVLLLLAVLGAGAWWRGQCSRGASGAKGSAPLSSSSGKSAATAAAAAAAADVVLPNPLPLHAPSGADAAGSSLPPGWVAHVNGSETWYSCTATGETQWERPGGV